MIMLISVINHSNGIVSDSQAQKAINAVNRQIAEDFEPYWSMGARLRLDGRTVDQPNKITTPDMRGDAVLYLWDDSDVPHAEGYHDTNHSGVPFSFVFVHPGNSGWTVTLSHEALEMVADPDVNLLVAGPHPDDPENRVALFAYEVADAVQADTYEIEGIKVSNFVLPLYFTAENEYEGRNDFLGKKHNGKTLTSFGVNPRGYMPYFDLDGGKWSEVYGKDAENIFKMKKERFGALHRGTRYERLTTRFKKIK